MVGSTLLFYGGISFAYFVVFPLAFAFFTSVAPEGVTIATDISSYLDFVLKLFFAFGAAFEIPIAIMLLCWTGFTNPDSLRKKRPYIVGRCIRCRHVANTTRYYFTNFAGNSYAIAF